VNVNGQLAQVHRDDFAVIVPLQIGQNIITATATRPDGVQGQAQITINTESQQEFVRLTATPTSGILDQTGILNVTFEAEAYLPNPASGYSWDFNGDGVAEITGTDAQVIAQYQYPGIYFPRVTVTDNQGNTFTETTLVSILSREEMDALLRSKWEGMKGALSQGNIGGAISYFDDSSKSAYTEHFTLLSPMLSQIVQELNDTQFIGMMTNAIEYDIRTIRNGKEYSFYLLFVKDKDGLWKIRSF
jgi:PKD repeat protein